MGPARHGEQQSGFGARIGVHHCGTRNASPQDSRREVFLRNSAGLAEANKLKISEGRERFPDRRPGRGAECVRRPGEEPVQWRAVRSDTNMRRKNSCRSARWRGRVLSWRAKTL